MEISAIDMYLILKLDNFIHMFRVFAVVLGVIFILSLLLLPIALCELKDIKTVIPIIKKYIIIMPTCIVLCAVLSTIVPSTKQLAAIIVVPKIVNNEYVQEIPEKLLNFGIEWLEELKPETNKND